MASEPNSAETGSAEKRHRWLSLTVFAWAAPILTPLAFALVLWSGLDEKAADAANGVIGGWSSFDPPTMFVWGWVALTIACAGWIAWRLAAKRKGATRIISFLLMWPVLTALLGAAGMAVGMPACLPNLDH